MGGKTRIALSIGWFALVTTASGIAKQPAHPTTEIIAKEAGRLAPGPCYWIGDFWYCPPTAP